MADLFDVIIISHDKTIYEGRVSSLIAPSESGYLGILANHAPLIACLARGRIAFKEESGAVTAFISEATGFLEVLKNKVTILLEHNGLTRSTVPSII